MRRLTPRWRSRTRATTGGKEMTGVGRADPDAHLAADAGALRAQLMTGAVGFTDDDGRAFVE